MKQIILAVLSLTVLSCTNLLADFQGPSTTKDVTTVAEAKKALDDTKVVLTGNIIKKIKDEYYTFKDKTGEIIVEIDDDNIRGITITPETDVTIYGEVDKENGVLDSGLAGSVDIEVDRVQINTATTPK